MLGLQLLELSAQLTFSPSNKTGKALNVSQPEAVQLVTAWFLRIWFIHTVSPNILEQAIATYNSENNPYTFFQVVRILIQRGFHEPSERQRRLAQSLSTAIFYAGPPLESPDWWEPTIADQGRAYTLPEEALFGIVDLAKKSSDSEIQSLFPQVTAPQFESNQTLVSSDLNALRAKLYIQAAGMSNPYPALNHLVKWDPSLEYHIDRFPPEDHHREYKATFRWDSEHRQKNINQQVACLKAICGFLNADGGTLVIGIDDNLSVVGLEGDFSLINRHPPHDAFLQIFSESIKQHLHPFPLGLIRPAFQPYGKNTILVVQVKPSTLTHLLYQKGQEPACYVRDGNRTIKLKDKLTP